jgi:hypothetical protein
MIQPQFIATADTSEVRQALESHDARVVALLSEIRDHSSKVLREQAKGQVVEEQMEALAQTVDVFIFYCIFLFKIQPTPYFLFFLVDDPRNI